MLVLVYSTCTLITEVCLCFPCSFMLEREREREHNLHLASLFRCPPLASFGCSASFWCLMLLMRSGEHARNMDSTSWRWWKLAQSSKRVDCTQAENGREWERQQGLVKSSKIQWDPVSRAWTLVNCVIFLGNCGPNIDPVWTMYGVTSMCWNSWCASPLTFELMTKYNEIWRHMTK